MRCFPNSPGPAAVRKTFKIAFESGLRVKSGVPLRDKNLKVQKRACIEASLCFFQVRTRCVSYVHILNLDSSVVIASFNEPG